MHRSGRFLVLLPSVAFGLIMAFFIAACAQTVVNEKEVTPAGNTSYQSTSVDGKVVSELRKVFENTRIEGNGIFENSNEGLARRTAINLAVADLAAQVQTRVRSETVIYNNQDVRDVVENRVNALVNDYRIEQAGYDPGSDKYRVRVSISGETLVREIEKRLQYQ